MAYDFFLSYRRADQALAKQLVEALESRGATVWWDDKIAAGVDWRDAIVENLMEAHTLVILFSEECNNSKQLKKELALADDMDKDVIPVLVEDTKPKGHFLYELASRNWVQIYPNPENKINELADKLLGMTGKAPIVPAPMQTVAGSDSSPAAVTKTVTKTVTRKKPASTNSQKQSQSSKKRRNFLPLKWIDLPIFLILIFVFKQMMGGRRIDFEDMIGIAFYVVCGIAAWGAFVFPVRYFMRGLRLGRAARYYLASSLALYLVVLSILGVYVLERGRVPSDLMEIVTFASIGWVILGAFAFVIYGVMHFLRSVRAFKSHVEEMWM